MIQLRPGRPTKTQRVISTRELTKEDISSIVEGGRGKLPTVARFRDPHHRLARLFALGLRRHEVHLRSGYSLIRIDTLFADPAFQDLISKYRDLADDSFKDSFDDFLDLSSSNMLKAERQIAEKLDEADEEGRTLPTRELIAISRDAADRLGYGKKQTNLNVNVDFAANLEKALARSGKVIDGSSSPLRTLGTQAAQPHPLLGSQLIRRRA